MENAELQGTARDLDQGGLIAIAWVGLGLAGFFVTVRTGTRFYRAERLTPDDYWMLVAWAMLLVNAVLQTLQTPHLYYLAELGAGRVPADEIALVHGNAYVRYEFVIIALFWTVLWCVKASFLALFWRLFDGLPAKYRRTWWVVVAFVILAYIGCWLASALNCHPAGNYFNFGSCEKPIDKRGGTISIVYSTTMDILTDVMIMLLPLRLLIKLKVTRSQKIGLGAVFCLGVIIIITAIVRAIQINGQERQDPVGLAVWSLVESTVSVIVGSLPSLKILFRSRGSSGARSYQYPSANGSGSGSGSGSSGGGVPSCQGGKKNSGSVLRDAIPLHHPHATHNSKGRITVSKAFEVKSNSQEEIIP